MVLLGFAWFLFTLDAANSAALYTLALVAGGMWGGVFLHLGLSFPTGRLVPALDRRLVIAGYLIFPLAFVPVLLFAGPHELGCDAAREPAADPAATPTSPRSLTGFGALLYLALFVLVLVRAVRRWRGDRARSSACSSRPSTPARC